MLQKVPKSFKCEGKDFAINALLGESSGELLDLSTPTRLTRNHRAQGDLLIEPYTGAWSTWSTRGLHVCHSQSRHSPELAHC